MNIVLDEALEEKDGGEKVPVGMCVRTWITSISVSWSKT